MSGIILFIIILFLYFLPSVFCWEKTQAKQVFVLNLFLGWTLLGWVIALIWAVKD